MSVLDGPYVLLALRLGSRSAVCPSRRGSWLPRARKGYLGLLPTAARASLCLPLRGRRSSSDRSRRCGQSTAVRTYSCFDSRRDDFTVHWLTIGQCDLLGVWVTSGIHPPNCCPGNGWSRDLILDRFAGDCNGPFSPLGEMEDRRGLNIPGDLFPLPDGEALDSILVLLLVLFLWWRVVEIGLFFFWRCWTLVETA